MEFKGRLLHLDGLRGLGALFVFLNHFNGAYLLESTLPDFVLKSPLVLVMNGGVGVAIFFVLSGYVLSAKFIRQGSFDFSRELIPFLVARVMRIYLPFLAALVISVLCQKYWPGPGTTNPPSLEWINNYWVHARTWAGMWRESFLFSPVTTNHLLPQDWTLTVELNVSLFMPIYSMLAPFGWVPLLFYMLMRSMRNIYLLHFLGGISLVKLGTRLNRMVWIQNKWLGVAILAANIGLFWEASFVPIQLGNLVGVKAATDLMHITFGLAAFFLVGLSQILPWFRAFLSTGPLTYLGRISFGVYLLHFIVLKTLTPWLIHFLEGLNIQNVEVKKMLALVLTTIVLLPLCDVFFRYIETPSIVWGKKAGAFFQALIVGRRVGAKI